MRGRFERGMNLPSLESLVLDTWKGWLEEFQRCRRHASTPAVHHVRVESRRVLAVLALFDADARHETKTVRKAVRATLHALSKLRDVHVQRDGTKALIDGHPDARLLLEYLDRRERRLRKAALAELDRVSVDAATRVCKRLARQSAHRTPVAADQVARTAIAAAWTEVERRMQALDAADGRTIHRVRVALKCVRYILEAGVGIDALDPRVKALDAAELADSVRRMGRLHDTETLIARVDAFAAKKASRARAVASLRSALSRRRGQLRRRVMADVPMLQRIRVGPPSEALGALASEASQRRGRKEPDEGSLGLALPLDVDAADAALLERQRPAGPQENGRQLPEVRFVADQRDAIRTQRADLREQRRRRLPR
jgi:CHAD domain-containing protein